MHTSIILCNPARPIPDRGLPPPSNSKHQVSWHRVTYRASGTLFLFLTWEAINDLSLDSECLGNARRRVCVFYRWVV
jgi:hypothetical protein